MRRRPESEKWVLGAFIAVVAVLVIFFPSYGWRLRNYISPQNPGASIADMNLKAENEVLAAQLATLQTVASELPVKPQNDIRAMVFSRYPLNFKNQMLIDAGAHEGVKTGAAVMFQGILIGRIGTVFPESAIVLTVFDDSFKMPVRIGSHGYDGLLEGGSYPTVQSIPKTAAIAVGDVVYAAADGVPYGLPVGLVAATGTSPDTLFNSATLNFAYDANGIETVLVSQ